MCLTIERIHNSPSGEEDSIPFSLRRLVSKQYYIGPEGATLGTGHDCTVCLPRESGLRERHVQFSWVPPEIGGVLPSPPPPPPACDGGRQEEVVAGHFVMTEYPDSGGDAAVESMHEGLHPDTIMEDDEEVPKGVANPSLASPTATSRQGPPQTTRLFCGQTFVTGVVEWAITALPEDTVLLLKMFAAVQRNSVNDLKTIVEASRTRQLMVTHVAITSDSREGEKGYRHSILMAPSDQGVDVNAELCLPSSLGEEPKEVELSQSLSSEAFKGFTAQVTARKPHVSHSKLLLHVAIDMDNLEMVRYLLEQGADVSPLLCVCGGGGGAA